MVEKMRTLGKRPRAYGARKGALSCVGFHVTAYVLLPAKRFPAHVASVRPLAGVYSEMVLEMDLLGEGLAARVAHEVAFTSVHSHMPLNVFASPECFPAFGAHERSFLCFSSSSVIGGATCRAVTVRTVVGAVVASGRRTSARRCRRWLSYSCCCSFRNCFFGHGGFNHLGLAWYGGG